MSSAASMGRARHLHVVGAGLIGTSVALAAAAAGWSVSLADVDSGVAQRAQGLLDAQPPARPVPGRRAVAERRGPSTGPDIVCVAVPPAAVSMVMRQALDTYLDATVMDVSSVKAQPQRDLEAARTALDRVIWTHPLAGSERSGPEAASAELFIGRTWVVCPSDDVAEARYRDVLALVEACGGRSLELSPGVHDRLLAYTSHLPQLVASALAAEVAAAFVPAAAATPAAGGGHRPGPVPAEPATSPSLLAGPGLLDMTRLAASQPELWSDVAALNHEQLHDALAALLRRLGQVQADLAEPQRAATGVRTLIESGGLGRRQLDRKHSGAAGTSRGRSDASWAWVRVTIDDVPGTLARVFALAADLDVNIEDVHVDHAPNASRGEVSVAVATRDAARLRHGLAATPE